MDTNQKKSLNANVLFTLPVIATLALATPTIANAEGFALQNWSARGAGLAGGLVARGGDASAVAYNPAAITELEGTQFMVGAEYIIPEVHFDFDNHGRYDSKSYNFFVPHGYATHKVNDKLSLGIGSYSRFGLGAKYADSWPGKYSTYSVTIQTATISPVAAYKVNDNLSLGVGLEFSAATVDMKQYSDLSGGLATGMMDADIDLTGDLAYGYAFNLSAHYRFNDQWAAGLVYRMGPTYNIDGEMTTIIPSTVPASLGGGTTLVQDASATLNTPDQINLAVAYTPIPTLSFEAGFAYVMWSEYEDLDLTAGNSVIPLPKHWRDTYLFSLSAEYQVLDWLTLRAGVSYETSPMNPDYAEYLLPTNGRFNYGIGAGFHKDNWAIDLAYNYHDINSLDYGQSNVKYTHVDNDSTAADSGAHAFLFDFSYKF